MTFTADGSVISEEEELPLASAPSAVQKTIRAQAGAITIANISHFSEDGESWFEVDLPQAAGNRTLRVSPEGQLLREE